MHLKISLLYLLMLFLIGCTTRNIPKAQLAESFDHFNWDTYLGEYFNKMPEEDRWNACFDISDAEFKKEIVGIYRVCCKDFMVSKYDNLPDKLTQSETSKIGKSIDQCAKIKYVVRNKDKFVFDKNTDQFERCLKTHQLIKTME